LAVQEKQWRFDEENGLGGDPSFHLPRHTPLSFLRSKGVPNLGFSDFLDIKGIYLVQARRSVSGGAGRKILYIANIRTQEPPIEQGIPHLPSANISTKM